MRDVRAGIVALLSLVPLGACAPASSPGGVLPRLTAADMDPAQGFEAPPTLRASDLFPPEVVSGPAHRVREEVAADGFLRLYQIDSDFGHFEAAGDLALRQRVQEIRALGVLDRQRQEATYAAAERRAAELPLVVRWKLVERPVDAIEGMPPDAWREVLRIASLHPDRRTPEESALRGAVLEFEAAKRRLARRLAVNPYAQNPRLHRELNRVAWTLSAGAHPLEEIPSQVESSLAPLAADFLPAERLETLFAHDSPEDLRRRNRIELSVLGVPTQEIDAFLAHPVYSPYQQTGVVEALVALEPALDRASYVRAAMLARSPGDASFRLMVSLMLRFHHLHVASIRRLLVLDNGRTPAAYTSEGKLIVAAQVDYLLWTRPVAEIARSLAATEIPGARIERREVWLSGEASPKARREIEALGIRVVERVFESMVPRLAAQPR